MAEQPKKKSGELINHQDLLEHIGKIIDLPDRICSMHIYIDTRNPFPEIECTFEPVAKGD